MAFLVSLVMVVLSIRKNYLTNLNILKDLGLTHRSPEARRRLASALVSLCSGSRGPVVLVTTDAGGRAGSAGGSSTSSSSSGRSGADAAMGVDGALHRELADAASSAGASFISFNPVTTAATCKALLRAAERASSTAAAAGGAAGAPPPPAAPPPRILPPECGRPRRSCPRTDNGSARPARGAICGTASTRSGSP